MPPFASVPKKRWPDPARTKGIRRGAEDIAVGIGRKTVTGKDQHQRARGGHHHHGQCLAPVPLGDPKHGRQAEQRGQRQRHNVRGSRHAKNHSEQNHPRSPLAPRALHGMGNANAGIHAAEEAQRRQHLGIGRDAGPQHRRRKAIERQRRIAAQVAVEPPRDPPDASAQQEAGKEKRQAQQQQDVRHLMAQLPCAQLSPPDPPAPRDSPACATGLVRARPEDSE